MIVIGVIVIIAGLIALCWTCFNLAVYALPVMVGIFTGHAAYDAHWHWLGIIASGVGAAIVTLAAGNVALTFIRPIWARLLIAAAFMVPAAIVGYYATFGLVALVQVAGIWQIILAVIGAGCVGVTAVVRVATLTTANNGAYAPAG